MRYPYKIILPNYSHETVTTFLRFFYTGEILIDTALLPEIISLLREFNCEQQIPILTEMVQNFKPQEDVNNPASKEIITQEWFDGEKSGDLSITRVSTKVEEMEFDEYFESNDNVETIFFNENESEDNVELSGKQTIKEEDAGHDDEYLNEEYIDDNQQNDNQKIDQSTVEETDKKHDDETSVERMPAKIEGIPNPVFLQNLTAAVEDVRKNQLSYWNAYKKYGITRSVIFRHVQKLNEQEQLKKKEKKELLKSSAPSISFPALAMNINQLREEQNRFKKRLQEAINSCRDNNNSVKKAAKMFGVPAPAIERNLRGFKK